MAFCALSAVASRYAKASSHPRFYRADADFEFSEGLNILVGTNGTGKGHVLQLGYAVAQTVAVAAQNRRNKSEQSLSKGLSFLGVVGLSTRLSNVFLAGTQNKLVRNTSEGQDAQIESSFGKCEEVRFAFSISFSESPLNSIGEASLYSEKENITSITAIPVFIPAKEILSLMPDIVGISAQNPDVFDTTYTDLATQLTIRAPKEPAVFAQPIVAAWAALMRGAILSEDGRFYFQPITGARFRVGLAAEGFRKLGTLVHLLANGSLTKNTALFWDEPEAKLNSALLRELAKALAEFARQGFQIILATHSLFLMKEFHILAQARKTPIRYFGLFEGTDGATQVETTDDFETLEHIAALDAELEQTVDFQQALDHDDAN